MAKKVELETNSITTTVVTRPAQELLAEAREMRAQRNQLAAALVVMLHRQWGCEAGWFGAEPGTVIVFVDLPMPLRNSVVGDAPDTIYWKFTVQERQQLLPCVPFIRRDPAPEFLEYDDEPIMRLINWILWG